MTGYTKLSFTYFLSIGVTQMTDQFLCVLEKKGKFRCSEMINYILIS